MSQMKLCGMTDENVLHLDSSGNTLYESAEYDTDYDGIFDEKITEEYEYDDDGNSHLGFKSMIKISMVSRMKTTSTYGMTTSFVSLY